MAIVTKHYQMPSNALFQACPIDQGNSLIETGIQLPEGQLLRCMDCGHTLSQVQNERYNQALQQFDTEQGTAPPKSSVKRARKLDELYLSKISTWLKKPASSIRLLDVGCSNGAFLLNAKSKGFIASGIEPAPKAAKAACEMGLDVTQGFLQDLSHQENYYDAITLFEVIEHVVDPVALLQTAQKLLRPGGVVFMTTGNADSWTAKRLRHQWEYFNLQKLGGHVSFFCIDSLVALAKKAALRPLSIKTKNLRLMEKPVKKSVKYRLLKMGAECLKGPASWFNQGHDFQICFVKPGYAE